MRSFIKRTCKSMAIVLVIAFAISCLPIMFNAASATTALKVEFNPNYDASQGEVFYSEDDGQNWNKVTTDIDETNLTVTGNNLRIKIVPMADFELESMTKIKFDNETPVDIGSNDASQPNYAMRTALLSENGYSVPDTVQSVELTNVEFKAVSNNNPNPPANATKDCYVTITSNVDFCLVIRGDRDAETARHNNTEYKVYNEEVTRDPIKIPEQGKIFIVIEPSLGCSLTYRSIKINGEEQEFLSGTAANIYEVDVADTYQIEIDATDSETFTIMWTNEGATNYKGTDFDGDGVKLEHGKAFVKKAYNNEKDMVDITKNIDSKGNGCVDADGKGYVAAEPGNVIIIEMIPDYGYQLTGITTNEGDKLPAEANVSEFKLVVPRNHTHFKAHFEKTEDIVKAKADAVASGSIKLADGELDAGSAQLKVDNAPTLKADQVAGFEKAAGDFEILDYLDISLDQVFYKGKNDPNDVWAKEMSELKKPAEITLKLDKALNAETAKLVHEKNDGTYEVIDAKFDAKENTVTFNTDGFSNYAIIYDGTPSSANTSDASMPLLCLLTALLSGAGVVVTSKKVR